MLESLVKKICPLMTLALALGCGKKIEKTDPDVLNQNSENQEPSPVFTLQLDRKESLRKLFTLPHYGVFVLPSSLIVLNGEGIGKVKISYNLDEYGYEFHCYYSSATPTDEMPLEVCETSDNLSYSYSAHDIQDYFFPMNKNKYIEMQVIKSPDSDLVVDAVFNVDWK
jgi:hypothetical protein